MNREEPKEAVGPGSPGRHKRVDVLVSTPTINVPKRLLEYTDEKLERVIRWKACFLFGRQGRVLGAGGVHVVRT